MAVQGPFKKYFSLQNWILKIQKWQKVGGSLFLLLPGMRVSRNFTGKRETQILWTIRQAFILDKQPNTFRR